MTTKSIFIIYGDHQTRVNLRSYYEGDGHYVISSGSASEALKLLQEITPPDVIFIGGEFPYLSVASFIDVMKSHQFLKKIPISFIEQPLTSYPQP